MTRALFRCSSPPGLTRVHEARAQLRRSSVVPFHGSSPVATLEPCSGTRTLLGGSSPVPRLEPSTAGSGPEAKIRPLTATIVISVHQGEVSR